MSELTEQDKGILRAVHEVYYKAKLIDSPQLASLGLQFTQLMERLIGTPKPQPQAREPMLKNKDEKK